MNDTTIQGKGNIVYVPVVVGSGKAKQTNTDRIRNMTDEELAKMIIKYAIEHNVDICPETRSKTDCYEQITCVYCWLDWLKQEVE